MIPDLALLLLGPAIALTAGLVVYFMARTPRWERRTPARSPR